MKRLSRLSAFTLAAAILWAVPWGWLMTHDVLARTAIGQGTAGDIGMHEVFQLLFVAAHYGIRLVGGWVVLGLFWGLSRFVRSRRERPFVPDDALTAE